jgi:signal transduction histidine kinase
VLLIAEWNTEKQFKRVFEPGFTTKKKRLGIRIIFNKRIVEEYHRGSKVSHSEIGKGTTMQISLKKAS